MKKYVKSLLGSNLLFLIPIILLAGYLRLVHAGQAPPGFHQDEATQAWEAWCLLKTGRDMAGIPWPVFSSRGLGVDHTTLFQYALIPFLALGGLKIATVRLLSGLTGALTVVILFRIGARLFNNQTGLLSAALLAINPWHIHLSRLGHEAGISPFLACLSILLFLKIGLPVCDRCPCPPKPMMALFCGLVLGISCYGYLTLGFFLVCFLTLLLLFSRSRMRLCPHRKKQAASLAVFALIAALLIAPLAYKHITDTGKTGKRPRTRLLWSARKLSPPALAQMITSRYLAHFNPRYLLIPPDSKKTLGFFPGNSSLCLDWYMIAAIVAGLAFLVIKARGSPSSQFLLLWGMLYPLGDSLSIEPEPHPLHFAPGAPGLFIICSYGLCESFAWLIRKNRSAGIAALFIIVAVTARSHYLYFQDYYGRYDTRIAAFRFYEADLEMACRYVKTRLPEVDGVFWTTRGLNQPYVLTLVHLGYDPREWHRDEHVIYLTDQWDVHVRYGKMSFLYDGLWIERLKNMQGNGQRDHVLFVVRPGELNLNNPVHEIYGPDGSIRLVIYEGYL